MWNDEVVEEVRRIREEHAAKFDHNIKAIYEDAVKEQQASGRKVVSLPPKKPEVNGAKAGCRNRMTYVSTIISTVRRETETQ